MTYKRPDYVSRIPIIVVYHIKEENYELKMCIMYKQGYKCIGIQRILQSRYN